MVPLQRDITRLVRFGQLSRALDSPNGSSLVSISSRLVSHRKMSRSRFSGVGKFQSPSVSKFSKGLIGLRLLGTNYS
ncbi:hypothetical protein CDL15_Pgr003544 [Punica granatum]|uniref:Uncharacterized protein n=1 Tax=Punica granatum TaxID=22663 RepID=A0A218X4E3_PUNGR|nr:hypothetical protein CDL15_Pgr003544 [Punica granatum]